MDHRPGGPKYYQRRRRVRETTTTGRPNTAGLQPTGRTDVVDVRNLQLLSDLESCVPVRLNLGAGALVEAGTYSVDIRDLPETDVLADLEAPLDMLPDSSVSHINAHHVLEHVSDLDQLLDEMHRVLIAEGTIDIRVPHWANPLAYSDPTHVRFFGLYSFCYLAPFELQPLGRKVPTYRVSSLYEIVELDLCFRRTGSGFRKLESWLNNDVRRMEAYEKNFASTVWPYEIHCVLRPLHHP